MSKNTEVTYYSVIDDYLADISADIREAYKGELASHYTMIDASELIASVGMFNFLHDLFRSKTEGRVLTIEELEAMRVLHDRWEL